MSTQQKTPPISNIPVVQIMAAVAVIIAIPTILFQYVEIVWYTVLPFAAIYGIVCGRGLRLLAEHHNTGSDIE